MRDKLCALLLKTVLLHLKVSFVWWLLGRLCWINFLLFHFLNIDECGLKLWHFGSLGFHDGVAHELQAVEGPLWDLKIKVSGKKIVTLLLSLSAIQKNTLQALNAIKMDGVLLGTLFISSGSTPASKPHFVHLGFNEIMYNVEGMGLSHGSFGKFHSLRR